MAYIPKKGNRKESSEVAPEKKRRPEKGGKKGANARTISTICAVLVFLCVLSIGYGVYQKLTSEQRYAALEQGTRDVVVAVADISRGDTIEAADVAVRTVPIGSIPEDAAINTSDVVGKVAQTYIPAKSAVSLKCVSGDDAVTLAGRINDDKVAITVSVTQQTGNAGLVNQGDRVTLMGTTNNAGENAADDLAVSAKVLALGSSMEESGTEYTSVTVEVSRAEARRIAAASSAGNVTLALEPSGY